MALSLSEWKSKVQSALLRTASCLLMVNHVQVF